MAFKMTAIPKEVLQKLSTLLQRAILLDGADFGNIQLYDLSDEILRIIVQKGFREDFLRHFEIVRAFDSSACGRAGAIGSPVVISDVNVDIGFLPHLAVAKSAGFRAVKSIPLHTRSKEYVGVLSTHFKNPQWSWDTQKTLCVCADVAQLLAGLEEPFPLYRSDSSAILSSYN
jgi:hypothetical protein